MPTTTKKLTDKQIEGIIMLRSHGCTYRQIAEYMGIGYGSAQKYAKNVTFLPKSMRMNPFELLSPRKSQTVRKKSQKSRKLQICKD